MKTRDTKVGLDTAGVQTEHQRISRSTYFLILLIERRQFLIKHVETRCDCIVFLQSSYGYNFAVKFTQNVGKYMQLVTRMWINSITDKHREGQVKINKLLIKIN